MLFRLLYLFKTDGPEKMCFLSDVFENIAFYLLSKTRLQTEHHKVHKPIAAAGTTFPSAGHSAQKGAAG